MVFQQFSVLFAGSAYIVTAGGTGYSLLGPSFFDKGAELICDRWLLGNYSIITGTPVDQESSSDYLP